MVEACRRLLRTLLPLVPSVCGATGGFPLEPVNDLLDAPILDEATFRLFSLTAGVVFEILGCIVFVAGGAGKVEPGCQVVWPNTWFAMFVESLGFTRVAADDINDPTLDTFSNDPPQWLRVVVFLGLS